MITWHHKALIRICMVITWVILISSVLYISEFSPFGMQSRSLNVLAWPGVIDPDYLTLFEAKTGVKVNMSYFESNEELLVKIRATQGRGYDLILPGDYAVHILRNEGVLKKLDKTQVPLDHINPLLKGHYFDPENEYSIPYEWAVFGLGIDKEYLHTVSKPVSWSLLFKPTQPTRVIMTNDFLVGIPLAALYLTGSLEHVSQTTLEQVKKLLIDQKKSVQAYTDFRPDYYIITHNSPVALTSSSYLWRSINQYPTIDFVIPQEGTLVTIENFAIPESSSKQDMAYALIRFLLSPEAVMHMFAKYTVFPTTTDVLDKISLSPLMRSLLTMSPEQFKKFNFVRYDMFDESINEHYLQNMWITIKAS